MAEPMLKIDDINVYYGAIHAIKGISLTVNQGEIVTLIGANGAGKSTTLRTISGLLKPKTGSITFQGQDIAGTPAHKIVGLGISQVPEGRRIFTEMTVMENLDLGAFIRKDKDGIAADKKRVFELFPRLEERQDQVAGTLSGGEQQMLAMGRALMSRPKLLLLDEPSMGLAPLLIKEIFSIIEDINKSGTTVLLVEQNANMALSIANRAYVLETGRITLSGDAKKLAASEDVRKAYLGG
ncbi:MAG: ABC transporter ATP-binding protein [Selenomonas sp.]|uniref:ABC transporter ATP-binding protein n=1 Tax=uncultured Selenomonas sp. TaxID=159275 RepID=UPI0025FAEB4F|nr:ABC transporter ATP-binding protein [uncultured Selenomonas sp.]MDY6349663.1 ABC transporter ATP-binding protein [Selenomonas sp.]